VAFFADETGDVTVHTEHTFNILRLVVFYIRGEDSAKYLLLQKTCILTHISTDGSTVTSSQNGFLS